MKCINCQSEIPGQSRFCLNCGAAQPLPPAEKPTNRAEAASADGGLPESRSEDSGEFNWLEREAILDPTLDYEAQRRYEGTVGRAVGCFAVGIFVVVGLVSLIVVVPFLALVGLPLAPILAILTYLNTARLQERWRSIRFLSSLPGLGSLNRVVQAVSVLLYLILASGLSILLMRLTSPA